MSKNNVRLIAFYLPQYHPIPENNLWWGPGFTEWTNVGKAKALFRGHYQPRVPADLGYYDLRVPETRQEQASLAQKFGVEGFCYWHYWFGKGRQLLERPFNEVLSTGEPDFPFMLSWANESWKGFAHGLDKREILIEQTYPSMQDCIDHFYALLPAFKDKRYMKVDKKPIFMIYNTEDLPVYYIDTWNDLALKNGLKGIHFIAHSVTIFRNPAENITNLFNQGYNSICHNTSFDYFERHFDFMKIFKYLNRLTGRPPYAIPYKWISKEIIREEHGNENIYPTIIPNWDHSPRTGSNGKIFHSSTPELFRQQCVDCYNVIKNKKNDNIVFIKSWNEWAEGNYIEPDLKWGTQYLQVISDVFNYNP